MTQSERNAYQRELRRVARRLGLAATGDLEAKISQYCLHEVQTMLQSAPQPENLEGLRDHVAAALNVQIVRIYNLADLTRLQSQIPANFELVMATIEEELCDDVDALLIQRTRKEAWDRVYLAIINCITRHPARAYFSEWHELAHVLLAGGQLKLAFRRTPAEKKDPEEILVDRIAGVLAFYPPIFRPAFDEEIQKAGRLTFDGVNSIRNKVAPNASRQSVIFASVRNCRTTTFYVYAAPGYKQSEQEVVEAGQGNLFGDSPALRLRVRESITNQEKIRIHKNMRVPEESLVFRAYNDDSRMRYEGCEELKLWRTAQTGPIGRMRVYVEAVREGDGVAAIITEQVTDIT